MPMADRCGIVERARTAVAHYRECRLCEHRCGADRGSGQRGPCKAGVTARVFRHRIEYGEEVELVPSHLFYLSGCDLRCAFCIAGVNAFDPSRGVELTPRFFEAAVAWGRRRGARNVQWVGGEPTVHLWRRGSRSRLRRGTVREHDPRFQGLDRRVNAESRSGGRS